MAFDFRAAIADGTIRQILCAPDCDSGLLHAELYKVHIVPSNRSDALLLTGVKVILFGSYARGSATEGSDLDLLVVEREVPDTGAEMIRLGDALIHLDVGVDVLVYSEEEFNKRQNWCSTPVYWAVREGKVLYDHGQ